MATTTEGAVQLHHVSDHRIERFLPRPSPPRSSRPGEPLVWAIDAAHVDRQLLPRDCPRVYVRRGHDAVMWIEEAWLGAARDATLYVHDLPAAGFTLEDGTAGYWVSRRSVVPDDVRAVVDPIAALGERGVEVRTTDDLRARAAATAADERDYSIIRLHLAGRRPRGGRTV